MRTRDKYMIVFCAVCRVLVRGRDIRVRQHVTVAASSGLKHSRVINLHVHVRVAGVERSQRHGHIRLRTADHHAEEQHTVSGGDGGDLRAVLRQFDDTVLLVRHHEREGGVGVAVDTDNIVAVRAEATVGVVEGNHIAADVQTAPHVVGVRGQTQARIGLVGRNVQVCIFRYHGEGELHVSELVCVVHRIIGKFLCTYVATHCLTRLHGHQAAGTGLDRVGTAPVAVHSEVHGAVETVVGHIRGQLDHLRYAAPAHRPVVVVTHSGLCVVALGFDQQEQVRVSVICRCKREFDIHGQRRCSIAARHTHGVLVIGVVRGVD
mmetsp:Transcript_54917/g.96073  ORF Transcript_54917/g.96073 Transcript_54917/m.96073 type:complete len:320 (+) Transcript_54917:1735-2694(+)